MKQIPLLQGKALLIELPKQDFIKAKMQTLVDMRTVWSGKMNFKSGDGWESVSLPPGNWQVIGILSEVTEKQIENIMEGVDLGDRKLFNILEAYPNRMTNSAIEAIESWILAEGYYFSNPLGKEKEYKKSYTGHDMFFANHMVKYYEAQSRVLDRSRCLLLGRESN